ncbi:hypothetical protein CTAYLR_005578 [Chrysophaeum taylorii]|uniref:RNA polymerase sigma-70 domain-containing protein n=1 Tax=Chrysophaeum taylorii TaxID=2483200 RepID=A0AAD7U6F3_9STRA|nr:hypothetical protein CTAYLR_005578 [Chrysophaeum taylorii]
MVLGVAIALLLTTASSGFSVVAPARSTQCLRGAKEDLEAAVRAAAEADRRFAEQLILRTTSEAAPEEGLRRKRRRAENNSPQDTLFTTRLLDSSEERELGKVAQRLLRLERARDALMDERVEKHFPRREVTKRKKRDRLPGRKGVRHKDPAEVEWRKEHASTDGFLAEWAVRANLTSAADLEELIGAGRAARQALVAANMRLVYALAKKHEGYGVGLSDLVQEGSIGLMRAATKFDPDRGYKFSTYAYHWIRQAILRTLACDSRLIRLPMSAFLWTHGRDPSDEELCQAMDWSLDKLKRLETALRATLPVSTDAIVRSDADKYGPSQLVGRPCNKLFDDASGAPRVVVNNRRVASWSAPSRQKVKGLKYSDTLMTSEPPAEMNVEFSLMHNAIEEALQKYLTLDEQTVIRRRFGLADGRVQTHRQIAEECCETKQWVKSMEACALRKLRTPHSRQSLRAYNLDREDILYHYQ